MADIAILVAEEYERRVKKMSYCSSVLGSDEGEREHQSSYLLPVSVEKKATAEDMLLRNLNLGCVFNPKTNIGLAAFHGFFSA